MTFPGIGRWLRLRKRRRVLITEIGNASSGDAAIYAAAARRFLAAGCDVTFLYRSDQRETIHRSGLRIRQIHHSIENEFNGIDSAAELIGAFDRADPALSHLTRSHIRQHDLVAVAPGGRYTEGYKSARNVLVAALANELGVPVIVLHQSVGPLFRNDHKRLVADVFKRCEIVISRDDLSFRFMQEIGIPAGKSIRSRDLAFAETYPPALDPEYDLGLNIRYGVNGHLKLPVVAEFLRRHIARKPQARVLIYTTTWPFAADVKSALAGIPCDIYSDVVPYPDFLRVAGKCAINITDSFHGAIFSMMAGRPTICCQPDLQTWKIQGTAISPDEPLEILPDFDDTSAVEPILARTAEAENDPKPILKRQARLVAECRVFAENGWLQVDEIVKRL